MNSSVLEYDTKISDLYSSNITIYTPERQYPPKLYDGSSSETTTTEILNKTSYKQTITLNTTGITYGSGDYIIYSSSVFNVTDQNFYKKRDLFNFNTAEVGGYWGKSFYGLGYSYSGTNLVKDDYYGEWIIIKLPTPL